MKKLTGIIAAVFFAITAIAANGEGEKVAFEIDTKASKVYWTGKKVSGEHTGHLLIGNGTMHLENDKLVTANVKVDMTSIVCTDLEGEWSDKLVAHLKNDDFFSVDKFPESVFAIKSVKNGNVVGDLTIKGITHEVSFPAEVSVNGNTVTASGTASIDRTKYDIRYGSGKFFSDLGDKMISDEFEIKFDLKANASTALSAN